MPNIEWMRYGRVLRDNETFRTYVMAKDSNLQVCYVMAKYSNLQVCYVMTTLNSKPQNVS